MRCLATLFIVSCCLPVRAADPDGADKLYDVTAVKGVLIKMRSEDDKDLPALEEGVLVELNVRDGAYVKKGDLIARIDDSQAQAAREVTELQYQSAKKTAEDDIELRYAKKQAELTRTTYDQSVQANQQTPGAVARMQLEREFLDYERSVLQIEKAQHDGVLALYGAKTKLAELKAAQMAIDRRLIYAPFDGMVHTVSRHEYEWVRAGDPVVRFIRLDRLHVEGFISSSEYDPSDIADRPVTVTVDMARGRQERLEGRVVYYSPTAQTNGDYLVRAEVENRRVGDHRLVRPGLRASITIHVREQEVTARRTEQ